MRCFNISAVTCSKIACSMDDCKFNWRDQVKKELVKLKAEVVPGSTTIRDKSEYGARSTLLATIKAVERDHLLFHNEVKT